MKKKNFWDLETFTLRTYPIHLLPKDISVPNNFWMSPIAIQLLKIYHQSSLYIDLSALFDLLLAIFFAVLHSQSIIFEFKEMFECPPLQFSCWKSIIKAACTSIWVHFLIFFCYFFAVFKMIGREHQARLELPSFGFSKVRNPYAITDHPKMMLYNYVLPHHSRRAAQQQCHRGPKKGR